MAGALARARIEGRRARGRRRVAAVACAALALGLAACGDDERPPQTTAAAVTTRTSPEVKADPAEPADSAAAQDTTTAAASPVADPIAIRTTLEAVLVESGPAQACHGLVTERYVRTAYGDQRGCERAQSGRAAADRISVSRVVVMPGSHAQASVRVVGGVYDGERLRAELVLQDGLWRLDSLRSNVPVGP